MNLLGRFAGVACKLFAAGIGLLAGAQSSAASPAADDELHAALTWLRPQWSDAQEAALQAKAASLAGPAYFTTPLHIPGSSRTYTLTQLSNSVPDWWPQEHPPMPAIVGAGQGKALPCAACHQPNGAGYPANASLAGLSADYIVRQVQAFRSGDRINSEMRDEAQAVSDADLRVAAAYYAGLHLDGGRARLVEAVRVPESHVESWMIVPTQGGGTEALGNRIVELPENLPQAKLLDAHTRFVAYVPPGSVDIGKQLASKGDGKSQACKECHGAGLRGAGNIPPLAGRSPTYVVRQLVYFAAGERKGQESVQMRAEASSLSLSDMIAAAAYAGSLPP